MVTSYEYKSVQFFLSSLVLTWSVWFLAAYFSYKEGMNGIQFICMLLGLVIPCVVAGFMIFTSKNKEIKKDLWNRLRLNKVKLHFIPIIFLLMPFVAVCAIFLSVLYGQSTDQLIFSEQYNIMKGSSFLSLLILFLAPTFEELGWRGYGIDSLRSYFNILELSMVFAFFWSLWHVPLFFIQGYYHYELFNSSFLYTINYFMSLFPATFILNWIYYKNNRSVIAAILTHFMLNFSMVAFQIEPLTKCIVTVILFVFSVTVFMSDKNFFLESKKGILH